MLHPLVIVVAALPEGPSKTLRLDGRHLGSRLGKSTESRRDAARAPEPSLQPPGATARPTRIINRALRSQHFLKSASQSGRPHYSTSASEIHLTTKPPVGRRCQKNSNIDGVPEM